jgi:molybdate transport system substrate-binding protein
VSAGSSNSSGCVRRRTALELLAALSLAFAARGCKKSEAVAAKPAREPKPEAVARGRGPLVVFAASSLREGFEALAQAFEEETGESGIDFNFAGTQQLRLQLEQGAVGDVFASADQRHMKELVSAARVTDPQTFARNELVLVVDKKGTLKSFADLPKAQRVVIGAPEVPIGQYTLTLIDNAWTSYGADFRARVEAHVVSRELNVRQVLAKVTLGEADAGVVYRTDVVRAKDVVVVAIPEELNVIAEYLIGVVADAPHANLAQKWRRFVLSRAGSKILLARGFLPARATQAAP